MHDRENKNASESGCKKKFGLCFEFTRGGEKKVWKCVIRGAQRFAPFRFHNVPDEVSIDELAEAT